MLNQRNGDMASIRISQTSLETVRKSLFALYDLAKTLKTDKKWFIYGHKTVLNLHAIVSDNRYDELMTEMNFIFIEQFLAQPPAIN